MSTSRHPIALRLERRVGRGTHLLGTVMGLPLVDGIFPALVLAGALTTAGGDAISLRGVLEVGLLVFGGSATLAVVLAEMEGSRRERALSVLAVGSVVLVVAAIEAALAPTIESVLNMAVFPRFAALVILAVAAKTASSTIGEYLPSPGTIVGLGLLASLDPSGFEFVVTPDPTMILAGVAAAGVGVGFALVVALAGPTLRRWVDIDRFRFGSAVALGVLPLTLLGIIEADRPLALAVLGVTCLLSLDPDSGSVDEGTDDRDDYDDGTGTGVESPGAGTPDGQFDAPQGGRRSSVADPEADRTFSDPEARGASAAADGGQSPDGDDPRARDPERAPWL
ncbi:DUF5794 domain-containing protein [Halomarina litorea]|uniref:DUF5794 domain-containing protein n=1 Tax=Halomarina litorea TaxID=2961595 RepID=UPI0020C3C4F6|nr:DUF5794 domain-containing protein [Halomarina sp. BCD28]